MQDSRPFRESLLTAGCVTALAAVVYFAPWPVVQAAALLFAAVFACAFVLHPEFLARRLGTVLVYAGVMPTGILLNGRLLSGDAPAVDTLFLMQVLGTPGPWLIVGGIVLLLGDGTLRLVAGHFGGPRLRMPRYRLSTVRSAEPENGRFTLEADVEVYKPKGTPLVIRGMRVKAAFLGAHATVPGERCSVAKRCAALGLDEADEKNGVDVTGTDIAHCRVRVELDHRVLRWSARWPRLLRWLVRRVIVRQLGAVVSLKTGGMYPGLGTVLYASVPEGPAPQGHSASRSVAGGTTSVT